MGGQGRVQTERATDPGAPSFMKSIGGVLRGSQAKARLVNSNHKE